MFETPLLTYPEVLEIYRLVKIFPASMFLKDIVAMLKIID